MSDFKQMKLVDHDDPLEVTARVESEQELAGLAWTVTRNGSLADLSKTENELVDAASKVSDGTIGDLVNAIQQGGDPLGDAFVRLRSARQRRSMGAVYTPPEIVNAMVGWISAEEVVAAADIGPAGTRGIRPARGTLSGASGCGYRRQLHLDHQGQ
ncbi:MAG: hypothetical protein OXG34_09580 [bacterium]|nr:hypothetical protein [bacterium]